MTTSAGSELRAVVGTLAELESLAAQVGLAAAAAEAADVRRRAAEHRLQLVVLGQFKRGKSSVVNAMLGGEVMPTGVLPVTSVSTRVVWGMRPEVTVEYREGRRETVSLERLRDYVSEAGNSENRKGVAAVEVRYPAPLLRDGVVLVDTPGVGSTVAGNTDAAYAYLDEADAAVAVVGGDPPLTAAEAEYLRAASARAVRTFFVHNKIDAAEPAEWQEALSFNAAQLGRALGGPPPKIFPVSARWAMQAPGGHPAEFWRRSGFPDLMGELARFLRDEREQVFLTATVRRTRAIAESVQIGFLLRRSARSTPLQRWESNVARLQEHLADIERRRDRAVVLFREDVRRLTAGLAEQMDSLRRQWSDELAQTVATWVRGQVRAGTRPSADALDAEIGRRVTERLLPWRVGQLERLQTAYGEVVDRFAGEFDRLTAAVHEAYAALAGTEPHPMAADRHLTVRIPFYLQLSDTPTFFPELSAVTLSPLLPAVLAARVLERRARERAAELVDRNCGRVRYDIAYRLEESARRFEGDLLSHLAAVQADLAQLLQRAAAERQGRRERMAADLADIDATLRRVGAMVAAVVGMAPGPARPKLGAASPARRPSI